MINSFKLDSRNNFEINDDDLSDWDFYNNERKKIDANNLINYNPVLKEQRKSLSPVFRAVIKGYITSNIDLNVENINNLKKDKNEIPKENQAEKSINFSGKTFSTKQNLSLVLKFANNEKKINYNFYSNLNSKTLYTDTADRNQIFLDDEFEENNKPYFSEKPMQFQNNNLDLNNNFNFSENFFIEDFHNLGNLKKYNKSAKKHEWDFNNNFADERILLTQIKQQEAEKKLLTIKKENKFKDDQKKDYENNFYIPKYSVTKELLIKEINEKDKGSLKSKLELYKTNNDFENVEFAISKNTQEYLGEKDNLNESFDKEKSALYHTFDNSKFNNKYLSKADTYNLTRNNEDSKNFNKTNKNNLDKISTVEENGNIFVLKITKENQEYTLNDKENLNFSKSNKKLSLLDKYIEHKATEYLNDNIKINFYSNLN
jgi:hypothetical protein